MIKKIAVLLSMLILINPVLPVFPKLKAEATAVSNPFAVQDNLRSRSILNSKQKCTVKSKQSKAKTVKTPVTRYNIKFKNSVSLSAIYSCVSKYTYKMLGQSSSRMFRVNVGSLDTFKKKYAGIIESIKKDNTVKIDATANDTYFAHQWALDNIKIPQAWDVTEGASSVKVAVIDSGFDRTHEDFNSTQILNGSDITDNNSAVTDDAEGHGTEVASVVAAATNNGKGIAGAARNVSVIPYKVEDDNGNIYDSDIVSAITMAADAGCDVINISLGAYEYDALLQQAVTYANSKGCIVVAAAGNEGEVGDPDRGKLCYPASYDGVVSVAATNSDNGICGFSQYNADITVAAPGENVLVAEPFSKTAYTASSGTSFSSPYVAAVAALARSVDKKLSTAEFKQLIKQTSTDLGAPSRDNYYGWGLINAQALVTAAKSPIIIGVDNNGVYNTSKTITFNGVTAKLNGNAFTSGSKVSANGSYTLVVTNASGNSTTVNFKLDNVPPTITGVSNNKYYNTTRTVTFDKGTATLNGKTFTSGSSVSDEGSYTLKVTDAAGSPATVQFYIDKMSPVINGVNDGETYHSAVKISFNEGTAKLNGNAFTNNTVVSTAGSYDLEVTDTAGNISSAHFTILSIPVPTSISISSQLTKWVMDSGSGYLCAISESDSKLFFINTSTMAIDKTITLPSAPTDIIDDSGKLYIALDDINKIQVVDAATKTLGAQLTTTVDPYMLAKDGNNLFYTQFDQWCQVHKYDLSTNTDTKLCTTSEGSIGEFSQPAIAVNTSTHVLYIGESGLTGSKLYYYSETQEKIIAKCNYNNGYGFCGPVRYIIYDGQYVYYAGRRFAPDDPNKYSASFYNCNQESIVFKINGCIITNLGAVYSENELKKLGNISACIVLAEASNSKTLFYYNNSFNNKKIYKVSANSDIDENNIIGLLGGTAAVTSNQKNSVQINSSINKVQLNSSITKWVNDDANHKIYAISSVGKCLYFIDQQTLSVESRIDFSGPPTDIVEENGKLYIALDDSNEIVRVDIASKAVDKTITTQVDPYALAIDGNNLFYTQHYQQCEVHKYDLSTDDDTKLPMLATEPALEVNTTLHILYVGESEATGTRLYYYDETKGTVSSCYVDNNCNYSRNISFDGQYVYYMGKAYDSSVPTRIAGTFDNNPVMLIKNGLIITANGSNYNFIDSDTFLKIGTYSGNLSLIETSSDGKLFIYNSTHNTVESIQSETGKIDKSNIISIIPGATSASQVQLTKGEKLEDGMFGLSVDSPITKWVLDDNSNTVFSITSDKEVLCINSSTLDLEKVIPLKNVPTDLTLDSGKLYVAFDSSSQIAVVDTASRTVDSTFYTQYDPNSMAVSGDNIYYAKAGYGYVYTYNLKTGTETIAFSEPVNSPNLLINSGSNILYIGETGQPSCRLIYYDLTKNSTIGQIASSNYPSSLLSDGKYVYYGTSAYDTAAPKLLGNYNDKVIQAKVGFVFTTSSMYIAGQYDTPNQMPIKYNLVEISKNTDLFFYNKTNNYIEKYCLSDYSNVAGLEDGKTYSDKATISFDSGTAYLDNQPVTSGTTVTAHGDHQLLYFDDNSNCEEVGFSIVISVQSITLDQSKLNLHINGKQYLNATINPTDADDQYIDWTSSDESVATVDENGRVVGVGEGTAVITATGDDGNKTDDCVINVDSTVMPPVSVTSVSLNTNRLVADINDAPSLQATVYPLDADDINVYWLSSNEDIVAVDDFGDIYPASPGTATVTATTEDGMKKVSCQVVVVANHVTSVTLNTKKSTAEVGRPVTLKATVNPSNADDKRLNWSSSNTSVATVDQNGKVTPKSAGTVNITATSEDGGYTDSCNLRIVERVVISGVSNKGHYRNNVTITVSGGTAKLNGRPFASGTTVSAQGNYTLVVRDHGLIFTFVRFNIDKTPPKIYGVTNNARYGGGRRITFNEGTAKLNGKAFANGSTVSNNGSYTLTVTDAAGNASTVKFTISK